MTEALGSFLGWNVYNIEDTLATNLIQMRLDEN